MTECAWCSTFKTTRGANPWNSGAAAPGTAETAAAAAGVAAAAAIAITANFASRGNIVS
jgi:hypothetical protein